MAIKPAGYLLSSVTQGSADAFVEGTVVTGLSLIGTTGYLIRGIHIQRPNLLAVDNIQYVIAVTRRTKSASAGWYDADTIFSDMVKIELATSGAFAYNQTVSWYPPGPTYIVEDNLYFQLDSSNTSATNTATLRIEYEVIRITESERNALVSRTLLTSAQ